MKSVPRTSGYRVHVEQYRNRKGEYRTELLMGAREVEALLADEQGAWSALRDALESADAGYVLHTAQYAGGARPWSESDDERPAGCTHPDHLITFAGGAPRCACGAVLDGAVSA